MKVNTTSKVTSLLCTALVLAYCSNCLIYSYESPEDVGQQVEHEHNISSITAEDINNIAYDTEDNPIAYILLTEDVHAIARTLYGECRGVPSDMEKAAVAWVILNRVDSGEYGDSVVDVVSAPYQFDGYDPSYPVTEELASLAEDVLLRWYREKAGEEDVGRVLPADYQWFHGDGEHNYFRNAFQNGERWYWTLDNPYED